MDGSAEPRDIGGCCRADGLMVIASVAADDYNPFAISEPENPPTLEKSREVIQGYFDAAAEADVSVDDVIDALALPLHYGQGHGDPW